MLSLKELVSQLNETDECSSIEAKKASEIGKSILETICAFSNEPNLGGGYLLLGVEKEDDSNSLFPHYVVSGIPAENLEKIQNDLSSQCSDLYNLPIRPSIQVETINNKQAIVVFVKELSSDQKPLYIKKKGLPQGAYRRIGAADLKGTEDDLGIYYKSADSFDGSVIKDAELEDIADESLELYRKLRAKVNPNAEELQYSDIDLMRSINAIKRSGDGFSVTYAGLLSFGKRPALRRLLPMVRVDYIRVSTNEWVENPDERFVSTIDMRGSLLELVQRIILAISDDLPKGFELTDDDIQAKNVGLPFRVLREAVVNALIHRSYRENSPIQIIRYPNRIEIINPGFSLKAEEQLGEPGSVNRNPFIAAIFHETNLAETKGSGIRTMRTLMEASRMMPPTFDSDREGNKFTVRLLLHHFLSEEDLLWLKHFDKYSLTDNHKRILIFVREIGAVDNSSARQINGSEAVLANSDLRKLKSIGLIDIKGKNKFTYYIPSDKLKNTYLGGLFEKRNIDDNDESPISLPTNLDALPTNLDALPTNLDALPTNLDALPTNLDVLPTNLDALPTNLSSLVGKLSVLSKEEMSEILQINDRIVQLPLRIADRAELMDIILDLCSVKSFKLNELAMIFQKNEKYLYQEYVKPLLANKNLNYKYPDMINHPEQAYVFVKTNSDESV